MQRIHKGSEPACLAVLRRTPGATSWCAVHGDQKQEMREQAWKEQRGLCAYCMSRLPSQDEHGMRIEHFETRALTPEQMFQWPNLLGVCHGDAGADDDGSRYHCDRHRGHLPVHEQEIHVHPACFPPDAGSRFRYTLAGEILPGRELTPEEQTQVQLTIDRLNLNVWRLQRNRAQVLAILRDRLKKKFSLTLVRALLATLRPEDEYGEVARQYLGRKLAGLSTP